MITRHHTHQMSRAVAHQNQSLEHEFIYISAGVRGLQIRIAPNDLIEYVGATVAPISQEME